jgi:hypothetical protein
MSSDADGSLLVYSPGLIEVLSLRASLLSEPSEQVTVPAVFVNANGQADNFTELLAASGLSTAEEFLSKISVLLGGIFSISTLDCSTTGTNTAGSANRKAC